MNFSSQITALERNEANFVRLVLERPKNVDVGQRRSSMRIEPELQHIQGFHVWPEELFVRRPRSQEEKLGLYPPVISLQHVRDGFLSLRDISAGGMKIRLPAKADQDLGLNWEQGARLIIWLSLQEATTERKEHFWLKARIKHSTEDFLSKDMYVGWEFIHHGRISPEKNLKWVRIQGHVIEELNNWVQKIYIERFRKGQI